MHHAFSQLMERSSTSDGNQRGGKRNRFCNRISSNDIFCPGVSCLDHEGSGSGRAGFETACCVVYERGWWETNGDYSLTVDSVWTVSGTTARRNSTVTDKAVSVRPQFFNERNFTPCRTCFHSLRECGSAENETC
jgi:hypothetical protein